MSISANTAVVHHVPSWSRRTTSPGRTSVASPYDLPAGDRASWIRFIDGSTGQTDLIRPAPGVEAYSLDFYGKSPWGSVHYRTARWQDLDGGSRAGAAGPDPLERAITQVLLDGYPRVPTDELARRLVGAGYPVGSLSARDAVAGTQAALWHLVNGLELDVRPVHVPVSAVAVIGSRRVRTVLPGADGRVAWSTTLPAGQTAYLELELPEPAGLRSYHFTIGGRSGRHEVVLTLQRSANGQDWRDVPGSTHALHSDNGDGETTRRLDLDVNSLDGRSGNRYYRLAASGPADRDGMLDLRDLRLGVQSADAGFANPEAVTSVYDYLLSRISQRSGQQAPRIRVLLGSATPNGPAVFTPLVTLG